MKTQLIKIETEQLENVVKESGLAIQEGEEIKKSYLPFIVQLSEIQKQSVKINFESPQSIDETIARELRLKTVKIRTGASDLKDERKRTYLLRGNLEQAAYNLIAASCKLTEETFNNVEKAREIAEKKRKEILKAERIEKLTPYDVQTEFYDLANMPEETFTALLDGFKRAYDDRIAAEKKAEEDRIAKEKKDAEEREAQRLENIRLKEEAEKREKEAEIERQKQAKILAKQRAKAEKERQDADKKLQAEQERARKEKEAQQAKLESEQKDRERLANELKAKQEAEAKAEADKKEQERKAKLAPDKDKLLLFADTIDGLELPKLKFKESGDILNNIKILLKKTSAYIRQQSELL